MTVRNLGIIMNGATGGICSFQHFANCLARIRAEGGLMIGDDTIMPQLLLVGRDERRLAEIARANDLDNWTADLDAALKIRITRYSSMPPPPICGPASCARR